MVITWEMWLWIVVIIVNYVAMIVVWEARTRVENSITKTYFLGPIFFFLVHGISRIVYFYADFLGNSSDSPFYTQVGQILGIFCAFLLIAFVEQSIFRQSKHIFTIYGIASIVLSIYAIFSQNALLSQILLYGTMPVLGGIIIIIYAYLTFKSTGSIKTDSFLILIGIIFFSVGQMAHTSTAIKILGSISPVLAAIGMLIGMIMIALTFRKIAISS